MAESISSPLFPIQEESTAESAKAMPKRRNSFKSIFSRTKKCVESQQRSGGGRERARSVSVDEGDKASTGKMRHHSLDDYPPGMYVVDAFTSGNSRSNSTTASSAASTCSGELERTISTDGPVTSPNSPTTNTDSSSILVPVVSRAVSCTSLNSTGLQTPSVKCADNRAARATEEERGRNRLSATSSTCAENELNDDVFHDDELEKARLASKRKFFSPNSDRNIFKRYFNPSFHQRSSQFRKIFKELIEEDEMLLTSFKCTYQMEIPHQGCLYLSDRRICFISNMWVSEPRSIIDLADVNEIRKEKTLMIFLNSIQIVMKDKQSHFFSSFRNRDKSFLLMQAAFSSLRRGFKMTPEQMWELSNTEDAGKNTKRKQKIASPLAIAVGPMHKIHSAPVLDRTSTDCNGSGVNDDEQSTSSVATSNDSEATRCSCDTHHGTQLMDCVLPRTPAELFDIFFGEEPWWTRLAESLKRTKHGKATGGITGYHSSAWAKDKDGVKQRTITYTMALNQVVGPKSVVVTEKQMYSEMPKVPNGYNVFKETNNAGVPCADSFYVQTSYCVIGVGPSQSRVIVHGGIVYRKSIWMMKAFIEKSTTQGLEEHYAALEAAINVECGRCAAGASDSMMHIEERQDTSSEDGGGDMDGEECAENRRLISSVSNINFMHQGHAAADKEALINVPLLGRHRSIDVYALLIISLLSILVLCNILPLLIGARAPTETSKLAVQLERILSTSTSSSYTSDLDGLIAIVERVFVELKKARDAQPARSDL